LPQHRPAGKKIDSAGIWRRLEFRAGD